MSEPTDFALLDAWLWDLRSQHEEQLRKLAGAQRLLDQYARLRPEHRPARHGILTELQHAVEAEGGVRESMRECLEIIRRLNPAGQTGSN